MKKQDGDDRILDTEAEQRWRQEAEAILAQRKEALLAWPERTDAIHEKRAEDPYDGVLGQLPEWAAEWHQEHFLFIRNRLLDNGYQGNKLTPKEILTFMDRYRDLGEVEGEDIPRELWDDIGYLAHVRYAVSLGDKEGLLLLSGKDAARGRKVAKGASEGHVRAHGTPEKKQARWSSYQAHIDKLHEQFPTYTHHKLCGIASMELGVP
jgi:hypothetical protein